MSPRNAAGTPEPLPTDPKAIPTQEQFLEAIENICAQHVKVGQQLLKLAQLLQDLDRRVSALELRPAFTGAPLKLGNHCGNCGADLSNYPASAPGHRCAV